MAASDPEDRFNAKVSSWSTAAGFSVAALDLTLYEVANVDWGSLIAGPGSSASIAELIVERCGDYLVRVDADTNRPRGVKLAAEHGLTAYDAAYVAAARRHGWTLVSTDIADLVSKGLAVTPDAADYP